MKLWYSGSYYRYERPQKGRYRHFSQVGAEAIGAEDPTLDAELIILAHDAYRSLGLRNFRILLNSLGDRSAAPSTAPRSRSSCAASTWTRTPAARIEINPLRVLDDKRESVQRQLNDAPMMRDHLCEACKAYHEQVRELLTAAGVAFEDDPRLVRGLDYYTRTTFEFVHDGLGSQSAVGGGGRYDGLSEMIGGPALPSVGWALGVDRTVLALEAEGVELELPAATEVFAVRSARRRGARSSRVVTELRREGIAADFAYGGKGMKNAMKSANRSGARFALLAGRARPGRGRGPAQGPAAAASRPPSPSTGWWLRLRAHLRVTARPRSVASMCGTPASGPDDRDDRGYDDDGTPRRRRTTACGRTDRGVPSAAASRAFSWMLISRAPRGCSRPG